MTKNNFAIFSPETRFQKFDFHFFRTWKTSFPTWFLSAQKAFFAHISGVTKNITFLGPSSHLKKYFFFIFLTQVETSNVSFHWFSFLRDFFFQTWLWPTWLTLYFPDILVLTRIFSTLAQMRFFCNKMVLPFFHPYRDFKRLYLFFSYFRYFFTSDFYQIDELLLIPLAHLMLVTRMKFIPYGANRLQKNRFLHQSIFLSSNVGFSLLLYTREFVFRSDFEQLEELSFALYWVEFRKK